MILEAYQSRANRDARKKELKAKGYTVLVHCSRGSQMHPQYINDWLGDVETGIGNTMYKQQWGTLYHLEAKI